MLTKWKLILPGEKPPVESEAELPREPGYHVLKAIINPLLSAHNDRDRPGRRLEHVSVWADYDLDGTNFDIMDMFVDEDGMSIGLSRNERATTIYRRATMMGKTGSPIPKHPEDVPFVVGPAILFSRRVWF